MAPLTRTADRVMTSRARSATRSGACAEPPTASRITTTDRQTSPSGRCQRSSELPLHQHDHRQIRGDPRYLTLQPHSSSSSNTRSTPRNTSNTNTNSSSKHRVASSHTLTQQHPLARHRLSFEGRLPLRPPSSLTITLRSNTTLSSSSSNTTSNRPPAEGQACCSRRHPLSTRTRTHTHTLRAWPRLLCASPRRARWQDLQQ